MTSRLDTVDVGGFRIAYRRAGAGPPIVCLHGYVGDGRTWNPQLDSLSDMFTVVAWDAPGFGQSSDPPADLGLGGYADALAGFMAALDLERAHLMGLSFGGALALELYGRHPGLVETLVLASAYAGWPGSLPQAEVDRRLRQALDLARLSGRQLVDALLPTMFTKAVPKAVAADFEAQLLEFHPAGLVATAQAIARIDLRETLPRIRVPTLLIYGGADVRADAAVAQAIHDGVPGSELVFIPDVGHIVNLEASDSFNAQARGFLLRAGRDSGRPG
jgi:pimeloyl-ACP methyl ester carboxylesterase